MFLTSMSTTFVGVTSGVMQGKFVNPLATGPSEINKTAMIGARQSFGQLNFRVPIVMVGPGRFTLYCTATGGNEVDGSFEYMEF